MVDSPRTCFVAARDGTPLAVHTHAYRAEVPIERRRTILLTNGVGTTEHFWRHLVEGLARDFRVVHWSYRGHGRSGVPRTDDYALATHADDLGLVTEAVMREGDGAPPIHVGFSMGVMALVQLIARRRELARALVLLAGPADAPWSHAFPLRSPPVLRVLQRAFRSVTPLLPLVSPFVRSVLRTPYSIACAKALRIVGPQAPAEEMRVFANDLAAMDPRAFWLSVCGIMEANGSHLLRRIAVPTLAISAERDVIVRPAQVEALARSIPGAQFEKIPGVGHAGLVEDGPGIARVIRRFLETLGGAETRESRTG